MNAKPKLAHRHPAGLAVSAFLSALVGLGIVGSVTGMFQSRGMPLGELAAAERACSAQVYRSERDTCIQQWIAATHGARLANK